MTDQMLPKEIDPIQWADTQRTLCGVISLLNMERLSELLCDNTSSALVDLSFGYDELGYLSIRGSIQAKFNVLCQRCFSLMTLELNLPVEVSPIKTVKEAEGLPENYDPLLLTGDTIALATMVEEEILLSIPIVPKHSIAECKVKSSELIELEEEEEKSNPFQVLKKLLRE